MRCRRDETLIRRAAGLCCTCTVLTVAGGCAMMMNMRPAADSYTYDVGLASSAEIHSKSADIFSRLGFRVVKDDPKGVYMESQWQQREPVDEGERTRGYEIISRVKLSGSPRDVAGSSGLYHVLVTVENRFIPMRGTKREARDLTSSADYARSIVQQMTVAFGGSARPVANEPNPF
jgi:hypothetical protein